MTVCISDILKDKIAPPQGTIIYIITHECDDTYYADYPTGVAFTTKEAAEAYCKKLNGEDDDDYGSGLYSYAECDLRT